MNINAAAPPWGNRSLITTHRRFDDPYAIVGGNPHPIATNANTVFPAFGAFGVDRSEHQLAARAVVERHARTAAR